MTISMLLRNLVGIMMFIFNFLKELKRYNKKQSTVIFQLKTIKSTRLKQLNIKQILINLGFVFAKYILW